MEQANTLRVLGARVRFANVLELLTGNSLAHFFAWLICSAIVGVSLLVFWMTFLPGLPFEGGLSLKNYAEVFGSDGLPRVLGNTLFVGLGTVAVSTFFALPLAWLLNRTDLPWRSFFFTAIAVSVIIPGLVKAMGWIMLLSPQVGLINRLLMDVLRLEAAPFDINSLWGIAYIQGLSLAPSLFFLISGPMRAFDPVLEEAAEIVGADRKRTLLRITAPLLWPAILGGVIYNFLTAISIFEVAGVLGGLAENRILATEIFLAVQPEGTLEIKYGVAGIYGMLIIVPSLIGLFFYFRVIQQGHRYAVITGKGYRPRIVTLGTLRPWGVAFVFLYLALAVVLPFAVLLWASLLPSLRMPSAEAFALVSFRWYRDIFYVLGGFPVIKNTLLLVVGSSALVLFFSFMVSWIVVRTKLRTRRVLDAIAMLPHAIPGVAFGFGLLIIGIMGAKWAPWLPLYNTVWIIMAANVLNRLSYATRITNAALLQIQQELEDAALICGARKWISMSRIMMPLIMPSLVFAGLWTALLVLREITMALLLTGPHNKVLATQLWILWRQGDLPQAAAVSIVLILVMGLLILALQRLTGKLGETRSTPQVAVTGG